MTITEYVEQKMQELNLMYGIDLESSGGRTTLACKILKEIFHTDSVLYEGLPSAEAKARFIPLQFYVPALPKIDFADVLARYYEELTKSKGAVEAHAWWTRVVDEFTEFSRSHKAQELSKIV